MKKVFTSLYSAFCLLHSTFLFVIPAFLFVIPTLGGISTAFAQSDSIQISHSEETGTLEKQRFIDRYDYVFMTKEPTKWMLKGTLQPLRSSLQNRYFIPAYQTLSPWWINFERKITPSFSLQVGITYFERSSRLVKINGETISQLPLFNYGDIRKYSTLGDKLIFMGSLEGRWYYDLAKRIKEGKSENNFSANYLGFRFTQAFNPALHRNSGELTHSNGKYDSDYQLEQLKHSISISYGLQRRFLKHGFVDFGVQLSRNSFQQVSNQVVFLNGDNSIYDWDNPNPNFWNNIQNNWSDLGNRNELEFKTEFRLGVAIGDFKKKSSSPLCEVLRCYETTKSLWKVAWPHLKINPNEQVLFSSVGYEQRIANTSFSVNTQIDTKITHQSYVNVSYIKSIDQSIQKADLSLSTMYILATLQPRFYFSQAKRINQKGFGRNLSGWYLGVSFSKIFDKNQQRFSNGDNITARFDSKGYKPVIGYQQQIFRHGYIDVSLSPAWFGKGNNPVNNIFGADLKLGFAF